MIINIYADLLAEFASYPVASHSHTETNSRPRAFREQGAGRHY